MTLFLLACAQAITVDVTTEGCSNVDLDDPPDEAVVDWSWEGDGEAIVWRTPVFMEHADLTFDPKIAAEGTIIHVYEAWGGDGDGTSFCYQPTVLIGGITSGVEVRWYTEEDGDSPIETIKVSEP